MGVASFATYVHLVSYVLVLTERLVGKAEGGLELVLPGEHRALSGDLEVHVLGGWAGLTGKLLLLQKPLLESDSSVDSWEEMGSVPLTWTDKTSAQARFPCGVISRGGRYGIRLFVAGTGNHSDTDQITELDVRWPGARLSLEPHEIQTYSEVPVTAKLSFQQTNCEPALGTREPETWLVLLYCGHSPHACTYPNNTHKQLVYSEQIRGYPENREITLKCELFGMAGHYALALRPKIQDTGEPIAATQAKDTLKAIWSDRFVFNVYARSIFPCDGQSGVPVLFQYPSCILSQGDRVRLFSRMRADVSALVPPSSLHYVAEQRVLRGRHSLRFDCSLFSEKFFEYCFVYVSKSITGAVSDVRMDCVPTLPVLDWETGGWGQWSPWTQCTSTCSSGTRNRYRFCDSPPPRYGAKFCEGHALETENCGVAGAWNCRYYPDTGSGDVPADRPEVKAEIGPGCRCGCIVHLGTGKTRRLIAASSHSCPGRTFWLIQTERNRSVRLSMEQFRLPCFSQSLKIRDGDSSSAKLLGKLSGTPLEVREIVSSSSSLLIEFNAGDDITSGDECSGGFLAHASQIDRRETNFTSPVVAETVSGELWTSSGLVNAGLALTLLMAVVASACLGVQYIYRYHKYQLASAADDMESFDNNSCGSLAVGRSRATSSSTLLSDVISLQRFRGHKHFRLSEENTELLEKNASGETRVDESEETEEVKHQTTEMTTRLSEEKRPTSLEVPKTPQLPRRQIRLLKNRKFMSPVSPVAEGPEDEDGDKMEIEAASPRVFRKERNDSRPSASSSQSSTLTNGSTPSVVGASSKETKEKRNRERVLAGSEFSLNGPDLEMDYYDYNVQNAVPGSYLAMDPAFCLWIPPFAPGVWDETEFKGSNEDLSKSTDSIFKEGIVRSVSNRALSTGVLYSTEDDSAANLVEKSGSGSPVKVHQYPKKEKETRVEKSPGSGDYYNILENEDGIKFADDEEEESEKKEEDKTQEWNKSTVIVQVHSRNAYFNK
ncbi:uncharacterized protein LOC106669079 isoform X2 [Cimex lectularius]|uniref:CUB domain-containing protein n=1 Tax=Cimex lectularius TaxID=79782 RepID=A0A8I6TJ33_CIMLE|nr:uncharacterized protein LOC106669079 isoform X2 [Cimex lectularius]